MSGPELVDIILDRGGDAARLSTTVLRHAIVTGWSGTKVRISLGGGDVHASIRLHGYAPAVGKEVLVLQQGYELVVLGPASSDGSGGLGTGGGGPSTPINTDAFLDKHTADRQKIAAPVQIDSPDGLTLHSPGVSVISLGTTNTGGKNSLNVASGSSQGGVLAPIRAGSPVTEEHLARVDWVRDTMSMQMSGPHGPLGTYHDVPLGGWHPFPSGAVAAAARWDSGMIMVSASCYLRIDGVTGATASLYFSPVAKWASGAAMTWHNGNPINIARLTISKEAARGWVGVCVTGWTDNRPGDRLVYAGAASRTDASASVFQFGGYYLVSHQFWPFADRVDAGLSEAWRNF